MKLYAIKPHTRTPQNGLSKSAPPEWRVSIWVMAHTLKTKVKRLGYLYLLSLFHDYEFKFYTISI